LVDRWFRDRFSAVSPTFWWLAVKIEAKSPAETLTSRRQKLEGLRPLVIREVCSPRFRNSLRSTLRRFL
jgi:hypothetical protein